MCRCRYCRLPEPLRQRVIDAMFRDVLMESYGVDVVRVYESRGDQR